MSSSERITATSYELRAPILEVRSARYRGFAGDGWCYARSVEQLRSGQWRVDYVGGLVEMFDAMPETRREACADVVARTEH